MLKKPIPLSGTLRWAWGAVRGDLLTTVGRATGVGGSCGKRIWVSVRISVCLRDC